MKKVMFILCLVSMMQACKQTSDLPLIPSSDKFTFFFTTDLPNFVSINDNTTGALIGTLRPSLNTEYVFEIPLNHKSEKYNVNFIYNTEMSYYNGPVQVESFKDVKPEDYRFQTPPSSPSYSYKKVQYQPIDLIDSVHNRTQSYFKDGHTELLIREDQPPTSEVFIKLQDETQFRYHYIEDLNSFNEDEILISDLPFVPEIKKVELDDMIGTGGIRMYLKKPNFAKWRLMGNYHGQHIEDRSISIPLIENNEFIVSGYYGASNSVFSGGFVTREIPDLLTPIDYQYELVNGNIDQFKIESVDADMIYYEFKLSNNGQWSIIDDVSNGTELKRPKFDAVVLEEFPSLAQSAELTSLSLTYLAIDNTKSYQELIKPRRRILGFQYEYLNAYQGEDPITFHQTINIKAP